MARVVGVTVTGTGLGAEGGKAVALALGRVPNVTSLDLSSAWRWVDLWLA